MRGGGTGPGFESNGTFAGLRFASGGWLELPDGPPGQAWRVCRILRVFLMGRGIQSGGARNEGIREFDG